MNEMQKYLLEKLDSKDVHNAFLYVASKTPFSIVNKKVPGQQYTIWHLCEHIRIAQEDIVEYVIGKNYKEIKWPDDYWPPVSKKATKTMWKETIANYEKDLNKWKRFIKTNYNENVLKKTILIIDHTSYHVGELSLTVSALTKKKV